MFSYLSFVFLLLIIIVIGFAQAEGSAQLVLNKTKYKNKHHHLGNANFDSFLKHDLSKIRLICIVGADKSGRTHLAQSIAKKYGHTVLPTEGKQLTDIRREFAVKPKSSADIQKGNKKKFIIEGKFSDEDLARLFKGKPIDRNFLLLFVNPLPSYAYRWSKHTGLEKATYEKLVEDAARLLKTYKKYRLYIVKNDFA